MLKLMIRHEQWVYKGSHYIIAGFFTSFFIDQVLWIQICLDSRPRSFQIGDGALHTPGWTFKNGKDLGWMWIGRFVWNFCLTLISYKLIPREFVPFQVIVWLWVEGYDEYHQGSFSIIGFTLYAHPSWKAHLSPRVNIFILKRFSSRFF